jgi:hypothetical protein
MSARWWQASKSARKELAPYLPRLDAINVFEAELSLARAAHPSRNVRDGLMRVARRAGSQQASAAAANSATALSSSVRAS